MKITSKYVLLVVFAALLQGCTAYNYGGKTYTNVEDMHNAQMLDLAKAIEGVKKNSPYVGGKALVFVPPRDVIVSTGVRSIGLGFGVFGVKKKGQEGVGRMLENNLLAMADAVRKGEFFDSVVVSRDLSGIQVENPNYVLGLDTTDKWQWNLFRADNAEKKVPVSFDATLKTPEDRLNSFNDSVSKALISLGSNEGK